MKSPRRRTAAVIGLLLVPALATTACAKSSSTVGPLTDPSSTASPTSDPGSVATTTDPTSTDPAATDPGSPSGPAGAPSPAAGVTELPAVTRRSIGYGQFDVTVLKAEVAAITPETFADPTRSPEPSTTPSVFLQVKVHNRLNFRTDAVAYDEVGLDLGDGAVIKMTAGLQKSVDNVDPGATNSGWYAYPVPAGTTLDGAKLVFGQSGYQQEVLPLTGPVPAPAFPKPITLRSPGAVYTRGSSSGPARFTVAIGKAYLSNAVAYDRGGSSVAPTRSLTAHRMLYFEFTAKRTEGPNTESFPYDTARLAIDGELQSGSPLASDSFNLQVGEVYRGVYVFDVPTTGKVELRWGTKAVVVPVPVS